MARDVRAARVVAKPNADPMRLVVGIGGMAALSALATAIFLPPQPPSPVDAAAVVPMDSPSATSTDTPGASPTVRYVRLAPGESAPPGATVIPASTSTGGTLVVSVGTPVPRKAAGPTAAHTAPPAPPKPAPTPVKTKQSGTPKP